MRKLIAMALLGASAVFLSATVPAQAMTAGSAGIAQAATPDSSVHEVRRWRGGHYRRGWGHRHYGYRNYGHRRWGYGPRYYGYGGGYYPYRYYRRPGVRLYFGF